MAENRAELRPCANPACDQTVMGRPNKLTCSPRCRVAFQRHRDEVLRDAQTLLEALGEEGARERLCNDPELAASITEAAKMFMRTRETYQGLSRRNVDPRLRKVTGRRTPKLKPDSDDGTRRRYW